MPDQPTRRRWSEAERQTALELADRTSMANAARTLGIPYPTVAGWSAARGKDAPQRTMGRPTLLTDDVQQRLVYALLNSNTLEGAAEYAGINPRTLHVWLQRGDDELARRARNGDGPDPEPELAAREEIYVQNAIACKDARAEAKQTCIEIIRQAAAGGTVVKRKTITHPDGRVEVDEELSKGAWQAAAWILERTYFAQFGRYSRVEHSGTIEVPTSTSDERVRAAAALRDELAAKRKAAPPDDGQAVAV